MMTMVKLTNVISHVHVTCMTSAIKGSSSFKNPRWRPRSLILEREEGGGERHQREREILID